MRSPRAGSSIGPESTGWTGEARIREAKAWKLEVEGLVERPRSYTLEEIRALGRKEVVFTLECSGNSGFDWFQGGIGNARWGGVSLAEVLQAAGIRKDGIEVVFYGADAGDETVAYIGGLGDKMGDIAMKTSFARSPFRRPWIPRTCSATR